MPERRCGTCADSEPGWRGNWLRCLCHQRKEPWWAGLIMIRDDDSCPHVSPDEGAHCRCYRANEETKTDD